MTDRVNPFGDLGDFTPAPAKPKAELRDVVDQVAAANNFPSRQPTKAAEAPATTPEPVQEKLPSLRKVTGRSHQVNIKTTFEAKKRLMELSAEKRMPLGEILELALEALEESWTKPT